MRKQTLIASIILIISGITFYSCKKTKVSLSSNGNGTDNYSDTCSCGNLPAIPGYSTGYNYFHEPSYIVSPIFNPNDDNEILFINFKSTNNKDLVKYNLITKEKTILFTGTIFASPTWSKQDWIVFDNGYNGIYKVRPDGSELTLFLTGGDKFNPKFNDEGDKILTYHAFTAPYQYAGKIWDINGQLLDSIDYDVNRDSDWKRQNNIGFRKNEEILIMDPMNKEIIKIHNTFLGEPGKYSSGFAWINEDEAILGHGTDVKLLNVWTGNTTKLICGCQDRRYQNFSVNGDGTKAIFNKLIYKQIEEANPLDILVINKVALYNFITDEVIDLEIEL